jgi:hypothetical protein
MGRTACTEPQCLYSRDISLLPLWAIRPVQSLSACTVELYFYSPYAPYGLYRVTVPVQGCTLPYLTLLYTAVDASLFHTTSIKCLLVVAARSGFNVLVIILPVLVQYLEY